MTKVSYETKEIEADVVIIGAGFPGICCAIQSARKGVKVVLINNRGVLGGNTSAEIGVSVDGACDGGRVNINSREGGICSEIITEYQHRTPIKRSRYTFDGVLIDFIDKEPNISLFLNTCIDEASFENGIINSVSGSQNTTETRYTFKAKWFVDDTGDGTIGELVGAEYMIGRESKDTFNERIAPDKADKYVIPSTLTFHAFDAGFKVPFTPPNTAFKITGSDVLKRRVIPKDSFHLFKWYYEIAGEYDHVKDKEQIIRDHKSLVWGIWDHIKNSGEYPNAEQYDIEYMACIPGTREYRRLVGDYIITESDIVDQPDHQDSVGHGGWNIDLHAIKGFFDEDLINKHIFFDGIYQIPYRTGYSKNVDNLFMCGRCMSTSHVAFGTTRVTATLATLGQAVGMALALCKKYDCNPRDITENHLEELQQELIKEDQYIVGKQSNDPDDLALKANITASSTAELGYSIPKTIILTDVLKEKGLGHLIPRVEEIAKDVSSASTEGGPSMDLMMYNLYKDFTDVRKLDTNIALSIPVLKELNSIDILAKVKENTTLKYNIYIPRKAENYGPDELIATKEITLNKSADFTWFKLDTDIKVENRYVLIELLENNSVELAIGGREQPTTVMFTSTINTEPNHLDYKTLSMSEKVWSRSPLSVCYKTTPVQDVYTAQNIVNGYNRPYGKPNMWLADQNDENSHIILNWDEEVELNYLQMTFSADLTRRIEYENFNHTLDYIAQDYNISYLKNGEYVDLLSVVDNHQKQVKHSFDKISTNKIRVDFKRSINSQVGVFEVRAYSRK